MRFTLRQLEVFFATARFENISRAAEYLSMSQSAASGALAELEKQFDIKLFDRVGKRLQLNELGRLLRPKVKSLLEQSEELEWSLAQHDGVGSLRVGATLTIGNYLAVGIMTRYMRQNEGARIALEVANSSTVAQKVKDFELDIGLVEGLVQLDQLESVPWMDDQLVVFCAPEHRLARKAVLTDRDLLDVDWILREPGSGTRQTLDIAMADILPNFMVLTELEHNEAIKNAVAAGLGISCLSRITLAEDLKRGRLVELAVPHRDLSRQFYFVLHKQKYHSAGIEQWMALCRETDSDNPLPPPNPVLL